MMYEIISRQGAFFDPFGDVAQHPELHRWAYDGEGGGQSKLRLIHEEFNKYLADV